MGVEEGSEVCNLNSVVRRGVTEIGLLEQGFEGDEVIIPAKCSMDRELGEYSTESSQSW